MNLTNLINLCLFSQVFLVKIDIPKFNLKFREDKWTTSSQTGEALQSMSPIDSIRV
jgi:hypothetical protein